MVLSVPVVGVALGLAFGSCAGRNLPWSFSDDLRISLDPSFQIGMGRGESEDDCECVFRGGTMTDLVGDDSVNECHFVLLVEFVEHPFWDRIGGPIPEFSGDVFQSPPVEFGFHPQ